MIAATYLFWILSAVPTGAVDFLPFAVAAQDTTGLFDRDEVRFVAGLRQRRLFSVVDQYCNRMLKREDLSISDQSALTVELIKNRSSQAVQVPGNQRDQAWKNVWQIAEQFKTDFPQHPKTVLVDVQSGLSRLNYATTTQQEVDAEMIGIDEVQPTLETMRAELRIAKRTFAAVEKEIDRLLPIQRSKKVGPDELSADQLLALKNNVRYQLALCNLQTARAFTTDQALDRVSAINDVLRQLTEVQNGVQPDRRLWWLAKISQSECLRLLGQPRQAEAVLNRLPDEGRPAGLLNLILEQRVLQAVALKETNWVAGYLRTTLSDNTATRTAQLDIAHLQAAVMLANQADNTTAGQQWLNVASQINQSIEVRHGRYWARRAALALIDASGGNGRSSAANLNAGSNLPSNNSGLTNSNLLVQTAQRALRNGQPEDAIKAFEQAIAKGAPNGMQLVVQLSAILENLGRRGEAANRLIAAANQNPNSPIAAAAHLRGCWNLAKVSDSPPLDLVKTLNEHLKSWPQQTTAGQAAIWLAAEQAKAKNFDAALDTIATVNTSADQWPAALDQIRGIYFQSLSASKTQSNEENRSLKSLGSRIVNDLIRRYQDIDTSGKTAKNRADIIANVAEVALTSNCMSVQDVGQLIVVHEKNANTGVKSELDLWKPLVFVASDRMDVLAARDQLKSLYPSESQCRRLLKAIDRQSEFNQVDFNENLNQFTLLVIELAMQQPLTIPQATAWKFRRAQTYRELGRHEEAIGLLEPLSQRYHRDAKIQLEYARALSDAEDRSKEALKVWRRLAAKLKPKSEDWYEAKYHVANELVKLGKRTEAKKLLQYVRAVFGWKRSQHAEKLTQLLRASVN